MCDQALNVGNLPDVLAAGGRCRAKARRAWKTTVQTLQGRRDGSSWKNPDGVALRSRFAMKPSKKVAAGGNRSEGPVTLDLYQASQMNFAKETRYSCAGLTVPDRLVQLLFKVICDDVRTDLVHDSDGRLSPDLRSSRRTRFDIGIGVVGVRHFFQSMSPAHQDNGPEGNSPRRKAVVGLRRSNQPSGRGRQCRSSLNMVREPRYVGDLRRVSRPIEISGWPRRNTGHACRKKGFAARQSSRLATG